MRLYWILLIFEATFAIVTFFSLLKIVVHYGKFVEAKRGISQRVGWLVMEVPAVLTIALMFLISPYARSFFSQGTTKPFVLFPIIVLALWQMHYLYRTFIFPFLTPNKPNEFPLSMVISGAIFNILNGYINGWFLFFINHKYTNIFTTVHFWIGLVLFLCGFIIHILSDAQLRYVKKINNGKYGISHSFLHKYVASPNYFGEWIQWMGLSIVSLSPALFVFSLFTWSNLAPRAFSNRAWYRKNFPDYPKKRKAIIPFIL